MLLLAIISCAALVSYCDSFLLGDSCLAPAPCTCSGSGYSYAYIYCQGKSLNTTPTFLKADRHVSKLTVYLHSNHLTTIPNYAFKNLSAVNATNIDFYLDNNKISSIDRYAFNGVENVTKSLSMQNNNLTSIPAAVYNLPVLKELYIPGNPIKSLGVSTQSEMGNTLEVLNIDLKEFTSWPNELGFLRVLKSLTLYNINVQHINSEAFRGFEKSLHTLDIEHVPYLDKIPNAICQLSNLQTLTLNYFAKLNENTTSIFDHCNSKLNKVTSLNLRYNHLTKFPDVFHIFPAITYLFLESNALDIIESEKVPITNVLSQIQLNSNEFKRIPYALNRMKNLVYIYMESNHITSIEYHDLSALTKLQTLDLTNNPIKYISTNAFRNNPALRYLHLYGTNLQTIPAAVMYLQQLYNFDIRTAVPISCTCEMSYLKNWNASSVRNFYGNCAYSGIKLQTFIMTSLQHCP
ncbi:leucine-rich repeats and immunoglobulin-like domains protein 3 [Ruditapes philippinarum]|uniref:leucine-rich repeats and immunoglobulin-like domains protein 3 n=1 Tax=Ruditapes philippinarum TaxID=129788 RepID=UPI00295B68FE|nr:leucine-rich repeats and immunoglobulin-like domains protein 3 [Ruditapes philippinarum]